MSKKIKKVVIFYEDGTFQEVEAAGAPPAPVVVPNSPKKLPDLIGPGWPSPYVPPVNVPSWPIQSPVWLNDTNGIKLNQNCDIGGSQITYSEGGSVGANVGGRRFWDDTGNMH